MPNETLSDGAIFLCEPFLTLCNRDGGPRGGGGPVRVNNGVWDHVEGKDYQDTLDSGKLM